MRVLALFLALLSALLFALLLFACDDSVFASETHHSVFPCVGSLTRYSNGYTTWYILDCGDSLIINPSNVVVLPGK